MRVLRDAGLAVVAGWDNLDRRVTWVHLGEISDIARFLKGGELLLTAGTGIGETAREQRDFIRSLDMAGAAGLILELGARAFDTAPRDAVSEAARRSLPFATLHHEIPFVEVTSQVHAVLLDQQMSVLRRVEQVTRELSQTVAREPDVQAALLRLAALVGNPVVLEDAAHNLVHLADNSSASRDPLPLGWERHSRAPHPTDPRGLPAGPGGPPGHRCAWAEVQVRGERWGRLHLLSADRDLDDADAAAADRAAAVIALSLLAERQAGLEAEHGRTRALTRFLNHDMDPAKAARQLRSFGVDLTRHHVLALAGAGPSAAPVSLADKAIVRLRRSARRHGWPAIVGVVDDLVLAIVGVPPGTDLHAATDRLTADMDPDSQWGSDTSTDPGQVVRTLRRANEALEVSRAWGTPQRVARWQELILPRLLTTLHSHGLLTTFVEAQLGPVLAHDADAKVKLLPTLAAVIEARGNKSAAAKALHLQRRTLYYRLARIEALLGHPVDTTEDTVALYLALRGLTLLRGQPNTHPSR